MKKRRKIIDGGENSIPALNVVKFIVVTCVFSVSTYVVISYLEGHAELITRVPAFCDTTISEVIFESSVWCKTDIFDKSHKTCTFNNLCWLPSEGQFIFLLGERSILHGIADWKDLSTLDLSSVAGHNRFLLKIAVISIPVAAQHPLSHYKIIKENEWVYFLWRFKPDNIMHIMHDDLLPLFFAYDEKCSGNVQACVEMYKLIFVDDLPIEYASDLYNIFSRKPDVKRNDGKHLFLKHDWRKHLNTSICFTHASIGLPRSTSWYQYGFGKPQGAIEGSKISLSVLKRFTKFLLSKMEIPILDDFGGRPYQNNHHPPRALYVSRSISRQIINENEVIDTAKSVFSRFMGNDTPLQVDYFNPIPNSSSSGVKEMLLAVSQKPLPKLVFGMHGAALTVAAILCMGMKAENADLYFMELFPLGVDPVAVSPLRALYNSIVIQNYNHIFYEYWRNTDPSNSILPSSHADPLVGGGDICQRLDLSSVLPPVECCHNQDYLCRMFQNTVVDIKASFPEKMMSLFLQHKEKQKAWGSQTQGVNYFRDFSWYFPASVVNIQCLWNITKDGGYLVLSWTTPINLYRHSHHYSITTTLQLLNESKEIKTGPINEIEEENNLPEMSVDFLLKTQHTYAALSIPKQFMEKSNYVLRGLTWIQCIVSLKHMGQSKYASSLDAFHECSINL